MPQTPERYALTWVTDSLAVGSAPMSYDDLESLRRQGVTAVLNLCAEFCDLHWIEADAGFEVYYLPIPDEEAPEPAELEKALDWLDEVLYLGKRALIHCKHGIGRTGTVLSAYLLRKGLTPKLVNRRLAGLRSKPSNFCQWWFIRKLGKRERPLTIRDPRFETDRQVELAPFFAEIDATFERADERLNADPGPDAPLCGAGHDRCCRRLVEVSFAEAVYISHALQTTLGRTTRDACVKLAGERGRAMRELRRALGQPDGVSPALVEAWRGMNLICPLNEYGDCLIFGERPLSCRLSDLAIEASTVGERKLGAELDQLSRSMLLAFAGNGADAAAPRFTLDEVITGRFVQAFFHRLLELDAANGAPKNNG